MLPIVGFQGTSLIDFPGKIASIMFLAGCNLRCQYCHNGELFKVEGKDVLSLDHIFKTIDRRKNFIDGLVVTGGEPSLYKGLKEFLKEFKSKFNLEIKLDTNGLNPEFIEDVLPFVDYFAIDIKTTPDQYPSLGSKLDVKDIEANLLQTKNILENSKKPIEYRTTMYPPIVKSYDDLYEMLNYIPASADYYLQGFVSQTSWSDEAKAVTPYTSKQLERMAMELRAVRGGNKIFLRTYA